MARRMPDRPRRLALLAPVALAAALSFAGDAGAATARLRVDSVDGGVIVSVFGRPARTVAFTLGGRPLARRSAPPYRILVRGHRRARPTAPLSVWLVARDGRGGRALARVRLAAAPPQVAVTGGPEHVTSSPDARFSYSTSRTRRTWCRLDGGAETRCSSPVVYRALAPGEHVFGVRAVGPGGSAAAGYAWTILASGSTPDSGPPPPGSASPVGRAAPPVPPSPYSTPAGALVVSTSAGLEQALQGDTPTDIVLANGVYDHDGPFWNAGGHRVYAASLGGAILHAGFVLGDNWGPGNGLLRGLAFDVDDPGKTLHGDIVHVWGTGAGSRLLDLTLDGHMALSSGIKVREPDGVVIQRVVVRNFTDWGINVDANVLDRSVQRPTLVEDVVATDVTRLVPQSSGGTSEACVWIGNTAVVRRVFAARCAWEGVWTGTAARGALLEDVRVVESETGVYAEHYNSAGTTFRRLDVGPSVKRGFNCEWSDPAWNSIAGCIDVVIEDSLFDTTRIGVYMDEGTTRTTIRRTVFRNQDWAAIADHKGIANGYYDNDYSGVRPGAVPVTSEHLFTHWP
jgi:hypothetical protein